MSDQQTVPAVEVEFESLGPSKLRQTVRFDNGSEDEIARQIFDFAWKHNARIVSSNAEIAPPGSGDTHEDAKRIGRSDAHR